MQEGLTEIQIDNLEDYSNSSEFSDRQKLALRYADKVTLSDQDVDDALFAELRAEFGEPAAIVELTAIIAFEGFRSKFNHALLVESNGVCLLRAASS
jgi:alkylhydroperoxidase family enzyme